MHHFQRVFCSALCALFCVMGSACSAINPADYETICTADENIPSEIAQQVAAQYEKDIALLREGDAPLSILPLPQLTDSPTAPVSHAVVTETPGQRTAAQMANALGILSQENAIPAAVLPQLSLRRLLQENPVIIAEFFIRFTKGAKAQQPVATPDTADFTFTLTPYAREMYVVFAIVPVEKVSYLLRITYAQENGVWQLYEIQTSPYACQNEAAPALFARAQKLWEEDMYVAAAAYAHAAGALLTPCGISYRRELQIANGIELILKTVNTKKLFPFVVGRQENKKLQATLLGADPVLTLQDGIGLRLRYLTEQNNILPSQCQQDTNALFDTQEQKTLEQMYTQLKQESVALLQTQDTPFSELNNVFESVYITSLYNTQPKKTEIRQENLSAFTQIILLSDLSVLGEETILEVAK